MEKFYYTVYGENIVSDFEIPELRSIEPCEDIHLRICLEEIPEEITKGMDTPTTIFYNKIANAVCFQIETVGFFYLQQGEKISIQCKADYDEHDLRTFTLGSAMGMSMILKGRIPIHGGTVSQNGKALIITGESGAGKSTISTALRMDGMGFVADDVTVLSKDTEGTWMVNPAYPQAKLCRDAALHFGYDLSQLIYINEERDKFAIRLQDGYETTALPFAAMIELVIGPEDQEEDVTITEVQGHAKLFCFKQNIYRSFLYDIIGMKANILQQVLQVISNVPIYRISRKPGASTEDKIVKLIRSLDVVQ